MKKIAFLFVALAMVLVILPQQTVAAETVKYEFTIINMTNGAIELDLVSTEQNDDGTYDTYEMFVPRFDAKTSKFPKGQYNYQYEVCGGVQTGTTNLKKDKEWEFLPCGIAPTKMRFNSHVGETITVNMYGPLEMPEPEDQEFTVELGGNRIEELLSGHYIMTYELACSTVATDPKTVFTEEIRVTKDGATQITIRSCEWYASPARTYAKPVPVKFRIVNHASFPLILQIVGPEGALLNVNPGVNLYSLIYGTYKFGYFLDGQYHTGYMMVTKNGLGTLVLKPSHIFELPTPGGEEDGGE